MGRISFLISVDDLDMSYRIEKQQEGLRNVEEIYTYSEQNRECSKKNTTEQIDE